MKKIISVLLVCICMISVLVLDGSAAVDPMQNDFETEYGESLHYEYMFHYPKEEGENIIRWELLKAFTDVKTVETDTIRCYVNGDVVFHEKDLYEPFNTPYCVYDIWNGIFIDVTEVDLEDDFYFPMLKYYLCRFNIGTLIGDLDNDDTVTILDATETQRIVAQISEATICDCIADFDRDGETTIFDATAIQMKLAKIEAE